MPGKSGLIKSLGRVICWLKTLVFSLARLKLCGNQGSFTSQCFELVPWWTKFLSEIWAMLLFVKISNIDKIFLKEKHLSLNNLVFCFLLFWLKWVAFFFLCNGRSHPLFFTLAELMMWTYLSNHIALHSSGAHGNLVHSTCWSVKWGHLLLLVNT